MPGTNDDVIRSGDNRTVKLVRSLRQRKMREAERAFVVEGVRAVEDALQAGGIARIILVRENSVWGSCDSGTSELLRRVDSSLYDALSETVTPQAIMAVFEQPDFVPPEVSGPLMLLVDGVRDPGNLGTLLRSAAGAGVSAAFLARDTVDAFNGKAVRAGMGAHFRLPIADFEGNAGEWLRAHCGRFVIAEADAPKNYTQVDWRGTVTLIIGSEASGTTELGGSLGTESACIPLHNDVESLNAGVAGSVMLFEAARQRLLPVGI